MIMSEIAVPIAERVYKPSFIASYQAWSVIESRLRVVIVPREKCIKILVLLRLLKWAG
jgi:hypothetical protein